MKDGDDEDDPLLTVAEAAKESRLSASSIYEACDKRLLTHHRLSGKGKRGKLLIRRSALLAWIDDGKVEAGTGTDDGELTYIKS